MKLIFTFLIVYLAYKVMFQPKNITPPEDKKHLEDNAHSNDGEYVDYEEVD